MTEASTEAMGRALNRAMQERMRDLLRDPLSAEVTRYLSPGMPPLDNRTVALLTRLEQHKQQLWEARARLYAERNFREDEMEIVVPTGDIPLPDDIASIRFMGVRLRAGELDDTYRVAPITIVRR